MKGSKFVDGKLVKPLPMKSASNYEAPQDFRQTDLQHRGSRHPDVDLCKRGDSRLCMKMREQDRPGHGSKYSNHLSQVASQNLRLGHQSVNVDSHLPHLQLISQE